MQKRGLGKGLEALLTENIAESADRPTMLAVSEIEPNRAQPRVEFDEEALAELTESVRQHGILQPLLVRPMLNGRYQIVAGERRWRAARGAGLQEVPVMIRQLTDEEVMLLALIENLQREQLSVLEEAEGYRRLQEEYGMTQEQIANRVGKSRSAVANALRLLQLPEEIRSLIGEGGLTQGHAKAILALEREEDRRTAAALCIEKELSVRETERLVQQMQRQQEAAAAPQREDRLRTPVLAAESQKLLSDRLGRKVKVTHGAKKGVVQIEYYGEDDLKTLVKRLAGEME